MDPLELIPASKWAKGEGVVHVGQLMDWQGHSYRQSSTIIHSSNDTYGQFRAGFPNLFFFFLEFVIDCVYYRPD